MMTKEHLRNRAAIEEAESASCFYCFASFRNIKYIEWTDKGETALCPDCGVDSMLPGVRPKQELEGLRKAHFST